MTAAAATAPAATPAAQTYAGNWFVGLFLYGLNLAVTALVVAFALDQALDPVAAATSVVDPINGFWACMALALSLYVGLRIIRLAWAGATTMLSFKARDNYGLDDSSRLLAELALVGVLIYAVVEYLV